MEKKIKSYVKQLKADLGIVPYSDPTQPEKFGNMTMNQVEENIDDFEEVIIEEVKLHLQKECRK